MRLEATWYEYVCPECETAWGSTQENPGREWCINGCVEFPLGPYDEFGKES